MPDAHAACAIWFAENMSFSRQQADPRRHLVGIGFVVLLHAFIVWALLTGMATKVVDVVRTPVQARVIEEVKQPLPPPPEIELPTPKMEAPPPPFIPPPEVRIAEPPPLPTITAVTPIAPIAPPAPVMIAPVVPMVAAPPPPPPAPPAPPPRPALASIGVVCPTMVAPTMPMRALREGISGTVRARATIQGGKVTHVEIVSAQPRGVFEAAVRTAMMQYACKTSGTDEIQAEQSFAFKIGG
jgi:protein TonB